MLIIKIRILKESEPRLRPSSIVATPSLDSGSGPLRAFSYTGIAAHIAPSRHFDNLELQRALSPYYNSTMPCLTLIQARRNWAEIHILLSENKRPPLSSTII